MASNTAPTTPDNAPRRMLMNRSVTAPIRSSPATAKPPPEIGATEGVETLYTHPNASIVKFTTLSSRPSSSSPSRQGGQPALLPWTSTTERTVAAGPLHVYRVPGSVSFLNSGALLHAILPRSQCWCVDGVSKFALRVLPDTYYRIELPGETEEDREEVERLKVTLRKVCFYERTPCPFERGFDVEIEDEADLEVRRKRRKSHGPAKKWKLDRQYSWKPEGWQPEARGDTADEGSGVGSSGGSEDESEEVSEREDSGSEEKVREAEDHVEEVKVATPSRVRTARTLLEQRSVSAPSAPLTLQSPPPSRLRTRVDVDGTVQVAEPAVVPGAREAQDTTLRTFQAIPTDMPPSPPDSSAGLDHLEARGPSSSEQATGESTELDEPEAIATKEDRVEEYVVEGAEEEEEDTVIIRDQADSVDGSVQESEPDGTEPQPDVRSDQSSAIPPSDPPDEEAPQTEQEDPPDTPAQRPATPSPTATVSGRRQSDPFTAETPDATENMASTSSSPTLPQQQPHPDDPFAAIQARILARRSIGGTTSFHPPQPPPTRQSTSSSSSTGTVSSSLSCRSHSSSRQQQAFASAMVKKACSVFLGPPAHLVAIMLRIAARFAKGAFGVDSVFYVESPPGLKGRVPGSYQVFASGEVVEGGSDGDGEEEEEEWEEDDFGVPLRSPVRLASMSSLRRESGSGGGEGLRERGGRGWDVD